MTTTFTILLFGPQAQRAGRRKLQIELEAEAPACRDLREAIAAAAPELAETLSASRFAVNHEYAGEDRLISPGDEIALIGPVSGG
ncbi:MAG: molybdopterin converting factor, subunit 1 [bacterium]|nr:molybdopterin converting factor, subunit 1 [bacterium]